MVQILLFFTQFSKMVSENFFNAYGKVDTSIVLLDSMKSQFEDFKTMKLEVVSNFYDKELE